MPSPRLPTIWSELDKEMVCSASFVEPLGGCRIVWGARKDPNPRFRPGIAVDIGTLARRMAYRHSGRRRERGLAPTKPIGMVDIVFSQAVASDEEALEALRLQAGWRAKLPAGEKRGEIGPAM